MDERTYVIKSFLSLSFFNPPNAIFVPGMYFFGFSRYSNYAIIRGCYVLNEGRRKYQSVIVPGDSLCLVGIGV